MFNIDLDSVKKNVFPPLPNPPFLQDSQAYL